MSNSARLVSPLNEMSLKFDLKGSKVKRRVLPLNIQSFSKSKYQLITKQVLKDQDMTYIKNFRNKDIINISISDRRKIITIIRNDVNFLESQGLMDYSLLLAVEVIGGSKQTTADQQEQQ